MLTTLLLAQATQLQVFCARGNEIACEYNAGLISYEQVVDECVYGGRMDACQVLSTINQDYNPAPFGLPYCEDTNYNPDLECYPRDVEG